MVRCFDLLQFNQRSVLGVGKTSVVSALCKEKVLENPKWTIGCAVTVMVCSLRCGRGSFTQVSFQLHQSAGGQDCFVELYDVGGAAKFAMSRNVFYKRLNGKPATNTIPMPLGVWMLGVVLVHDLGNSKSYDNLYKWLSEIAHMVNLATASW